MISPGRAVGLVALREIRTRVASRTFLLTTLAIVAAVVLGGALAGWLATPGSDKVAVVPASADLGAMVEAVAGDDGEVELVEVADRAEGEEALREGDADLLLLVGDDGRVTVVVENELGPSMTTVVGAVTQQHALSSEVAALGGDPARVSRALAEAVPQVERLEGDEPEGAQVFAGMAAGILIFIGVMGAGQMVAQGVVEEKSSRVVELLLATMRPWQLMAGKVIGIGLVGLLQIVCVLAAAVVSASLFDLVDAGSLDVGAMAFWTLVWFVLGYATYALLLAGLAALVSRQEDVAQVTSPVMVLMMFPYILAVSVVPWDPTNVVAVVGSQLPFFAPMLMPVRIALGGVETWELLSSLGITLVTIPLLVALAGRLYGRGILRTGARVGLRAALRG